MSNTSTPDRRPFKKARVESRKRAVDTADLRAFLSSLNVGVDASVHINGHSFQMALVSVDFGSPVIQARLSPEETHTLNDLLRLVAREVIGGRDANIRINHDGPNGIYWASIV